MIRECADLSDSQSNGSAVERRATGQKRMVERENWTVKQIEATVKQRQDGRRLAKERFGCDLQKERLGMNHNATAWNYPDLQ